ncbi:MAG: type 1 glutamine amidotransferase, partial [Candidatus Hydrothermarchaeaceae archaeon]
MTVLVLQHAESEHLGTFDIECEYVRLFSGALIPQNLSGYTALVILGGPMNVYQEDKYPYLKGEDILIKEALDKNFPTLGICLGSQLIAKAGGAKVYGVQEKEIGWYKAGLTEEGKKDEIFSMFE